MAISTLRRAAVLRLALAMPLVGLALMVRVAGAQGLPPIATSPPPRQIVTNPTMPASPVGLSLTLSAYESYDRNDLGGVLTGTQTGTTQASTPVYQQTGYYGGASGGLDFGFSRQQGRATFSAGAHGDASIHSSNDRVLVTAGIDVSGGVPIGRRTTIDGSGSFGYAPYYNFGIFPQLASVPGAGNAAFDPSLNLAVAPTRILQLGGRVGLGHQLSLRSSVGINFGENHTYFEGSVPTQRGRSVGGQFSHQVSQYMTARLGYTLQTGTTDFSSIRPTAHNIDIGFNYSRALSFARKTTVGFSTGSALLSDGAGAGIQFDRRHFRVTGSAHLDHQIGRSWSAQAAYNRGFEFVDLFVAPVFVDAVTFGVGGSLTRSLSVGANASYSRGTFGFTTPGTPSTPSDHQDAWGATSALRMQVARFFSVYGEYHYYWYEFTSGSQLPGGIPQALRRSGARAGVSTSLQLF
jgi:hypothetical protein